MASPKEKHLEKGCILPHPLVQEIVGEETVVLSSLVRFCACSKEDIIKVLELRNQKRGEGTVSSNGKQEIKRIHYGYRYYEMKKKLNEKQRKYNDDWTEIRGKKRIICTPEITLGRIQATLKERFAHIPVSLSATGGKPWDSDVRDADLHRYHPYLLSMDIKDAYPSIDTHRVYKNLQWAMYKLLEIQLPLLKTPHEKDLFIRAITHLCVWQNQLPQWASTSTQLQNIVMASLDAKVEDTLPELVWSHMIYSRYADDLQVSFPHFKTKEVLEEKMLGYKKSLADILMISATKDEQLPMREEQFMRDNFVVTDSFELSYLDQQIEQLQKILKEKKYICTDEAYTTLVGKLHTYKQRIRRSDWRMTTHLRDKMLDIIHAQWRRANDAKTKIRTPQSGSARQIHGIVYSPDGTRSINAKDKSAYIRLFKDLIASSPVELEKNLYYKNKFSVRAEISADKIIRVIDGIRWRCKLIYGAHSVPKSLQEPYLWARTKRVALSGTPHIFSSSEHESHAAWDQLPEDLPF